MRFSETLRGFVAPLHGLELSHEGHAGRPDHGELIFMLTVVCVDVDALVADPLHRLPVFGCVLAPLLSPRVLRVDVGSLDLFVDGDAAGHVLHMRYRLELVDDDDGHRWSLRGIKEVVRSGLLPTPTRNTTTLFVDVWEGASPGAPAWRGVLHEGVVGVVAQGLSFRGDVGGVLRFLRFYVRRVAGIVFGPRTLPPRRLWSALALLGDGPGGRS
ncbi:MAG: hypothetical protein Q8O67_23995 [Deltaproteobacteria bacterium]|nr:hypothetical protein [Deltaproteobacteria bacterium]